MPIMVNCPGCKAKLKIRDEFAGKAMKCPRCSTPVSVPADDEPVVAAVAEEGEGAVPETAVGEGKPKPKPKPAHEPETMACPECGKKIPQGAQRCRFCKAWLADEEEEEVEEEEDDRPRKRYKACPKCGAKNPEEVKWTAWGSFYGPKMFSHVRCRECGYAYNGRTGKSNIAAITVFITVPLLLLAGLIAVIIMLMIDRKIWPFNK
jgi:hypothetical protein